MSGVYGLWSGGRLWEAVPPSPRDSGESRYAPWSVARAQSPAIGGFLRAALRHGLWFFPGTQWECFASLAMTGGEEVEV